MASLRDQPVQSAKTANMSAVEKLGSHIVISFMISLCDTFIYLYFYSLLFSVLTVPSLNFYSLTATDGVSKRLKYV